MIRVQNRGKATPEQWIAMDEISNNHANQTIKLTQDSISLSRNFKA